MTPPIKPELGATTVPAPAEQESYEVRSSKMMAALARSRTPARPGRPAILDSIAPEAAETTGTPRTKTRSDDTLKGAAETAVKIGKGLVNIATHPLQTAKSIGRGVVNTVDDTAETVVELMGSIGGFDGETSRQVAQESTSFIDTARDWIFGPPSAAPSQQFVQDVSQFAAGFWGAGKFKAFANVSRTSPLIGGALKGAVVDFAAYDPYKEQLAELVGVDMLSVQEDDGPIVARFKRSVGGILPGVAIDGLVATARFLRASAVLSNASSTPAARTAAEEAVVSNGKILNDIEIGTHTPAEPVVVRPTPNGKYAIELHPDDSAAFWAQMGDTGFPGVDASTSVRVPQGQSIMGAQSTPKVLARAQELVGPQEFRRLVGEDIKARGGARSPEVEMAATEATARKIVAGAHTPRVEFDSRWKAENQAASINETLAISRQATAKVSADDLTKIHSLAKSITEASGDPDKIVALMKEARFNFTYKDSPEKVTSLLKAIGEVLSPVFDKTQGRPGVPFSESIDRARQLAGMIPREDVLAFMRSSGHVIKNSDAVLLAMDSYMDTLGSQVAKWGEILDARGGLDPIAVKQARESLQTYVNFVADVAGSNSGQGRGLNALKARGSEGLKDLKFKGESGAATTGVKQKLAPDIIEGMTAVELRDITQLFRQSKSPRVLFDALAPLVHPRSASLGKRVVNGAVEFFYNSVMSQPVTWKAIWLANATVSGIEDAVRGMAGVATGNKELIREAADLIHGRLIYSKQSIKGMVMALKAGHSIIDPKPIYKEIPGIAGEVIRTMGSRPIAAMDEFWRVNNNLAYVRMKALRLARRDAHAQGLKGTGFDRYIADRAEAAVRASIDPRTGASRLPEAREFAAFPTFSSPLRPDTFGSDLEELVHKHKLLVPILPFVRTSVNVMDYSFAKGSPLGLLTDSFRSSMKKGGEEAAITVTRMVVGSTVWGMASLLAFNGKITGAGPSNPELRKAWLVNNQPYSFKMDGEWITYRRLEPYATPLSVAADLAQIVKDNADNSDVVEESGQLFYGLIAATSSAMLNKTYMSGFIRFGDAIGTGSGNGMKSFLDGMLNPLVPGIVAAMNDDPYMRQTTEMFGALKNRVRGWSTDLPAKYNGFGEMMLATPGRTDRALNVFPDRKVTESVEDEFLKLGKAFAPPQTMESFGNLRVNLLSRKYQSTNKSVTITPYERWMELIRAAGLRKQIEDIVKADEYQNAGDGNDSLVGGRRFIQLRNRYERVYDATKRQMLGEFPDLNAELKALGRAARTTKRSDDGGQSILDQIR